VTGTAFFLTLFSSVAQTRFAFAKLPRIGIIAQ
jgi:hypothetical protein